MDDLEGNSIAYVRGHIALLYPNIDENVKLNISCFLLRIFQIMLNDENGRKGIDQSTVFLQKYVFWRKPNYILGSKVNEITKNVLHLLCGVPASALKTYFQGRNDISALAHYFLYFDNEEISILNLKILEKTWADFSFPYTQRVFALGYNPVVFHELRRQPIEPEENYSNPDLKTLSNKFPVRIPIRLSEEEVILLPSGRISLKLLQEFPRFLFHFLQKNYEHKQWIKQYNILYNILLKFLRKAPCDSRNRNFYFTFTSQFLRAQINLIELSVKLVLEGEPFQDESVPRPPEAASVPPPPPEAASVTPPPPEAASVTPPPPEAASVPPLPSSRDFGLSTPRKWPIIASDCEEQASSSNPALDPLRSKQSKMESDVQQPLRKFDIKPSETESVCETPGKKRPLEESDLPGSRAIPLPFDPLKSKQPKIELEIQQPIRKFDIKLTEAESSCDSPGKKRPLEVSDLPDSRAIPLPFDPLKSKQPRIESEIQQPIRKFDIKPTEAESSCDSQGKKRPLEESDLPDSRAIPLPFDPLKSKQPRIESEIQQPIRKFDIKPTEAESSCDSPGKKRPFEESDLPVNSANLLPFDPLKSKQPKTESEFQQPVKKFDLEPSMTKPECEPSRTNPDHEPPRSKRPFVKSHLGSSESELPKSESGSKLPRSKRPKTEPSSKYPEMKSDPGPTIIKSLLKPPANEPEPQKSIVEPEPQQPEVEPDPQQPGVEPDPQHPRVEPEPQHPGVEPEPQQPRVEPDPQQPRVKLESQPCQKKLNYKLILLRGAVEPFLNIWESCRSRAVYSQYTLLRILRLMLKTTVANCPKFTDSGVIFTKKFYAYGNTSFPKLLRAKAIEEFLNLSKNHYFFAWGFSISDFPNSDKVFMGTEFLLCAVSDESIPMKTQVQLCDNLRILVLKIRLSQNIAEDKKLNVMFKVFQTLVLKLKIISNFKRSNKNASLDSDNSGCSTPKELESFSFLGSDLRVHECSCVDYRNMVASLIKTIDNLHGYGRIKIIYKSIVEKESFLPCYTGLLKYALRAVRLLDEEFKLTKGFEEEKKELFEHIADVWCKVDGYRVKDMLTECEQELFKFPYISNTTEVFFDVLLYRIESKLVTEFLLEHLLSQLNEDSNVEEFLPVYKIMMEGNFRRSNCSTAEMKAHLPEIIKRICEVSVNSRRAPGSIKLLNTLFSYFRKKPTSLPYKEVEGLKDCLSFTVVKTILPHLKRLYQDTYDPIMKENIISICLFIPFGFLDFALLFIDELLPFVLTALSSESYSISVRGWIVLCKLLNVPVINEKLQAYRGIIAEKIYSALRLENSNNVKHTTGQSTEDIRLSEIMNVLSALGPGNWFYGKLALAPNKTAMIRVRYENQECVTTEITIPIEKTIRSALDAASKGKGNSKWSDCFTIVKYCYSALLNDSKRLKMEFEEGDVGGLSCSTHKLVLLALLECSFNIDWDLFNSYVEHYTSQGIMLNMKDGCDAPYFNPCDLIDAIIEFATLDPSHLEPGLQYIEIILNSEGVWDSEYISYFYHSIYFLSSDAVSSARHFACIATKLFIKKAPPEWTSRKILYIFESLFFVGEELEVINTPEIAYYETFEEAIEFLCTNKNQLYMSDPLEGITKLLCEKLLSSNSTVKHQAWKYLLQLKISVEKRLTILSDISHSISTASLDDKMVVIESFVLVLKTICIDSDVEHTTEFLPKCVKICTDLVGLLRSPDIQPDNPSKEIAKNIYKAFFKIFEISFPYREDKFHILTLVISFLNFEHSDICYQAFLCLKVLTKYCSKENLKEAFTKAVNFQKISSAGSEAKEIYLVYLLSIFKDVIESDSKQRLISILNRRLQLKLFKLNDNVNALARNDIKYSNTEFRWVAYLPIETFNTIFQVYLRMFTENDSEFCSEVKNLRPEGVAICFFKTVFKEKFFTNRLKGEADELCIFLLENNFQTSCCNKLAQQTANYGPNTSHYLVIQIIYYLSKYYQALLKDCHQLADNLWSFWMSSHSQGKFNEFERNSYQNFKVYKQLAKILLIYFEFNTNKIKLLFSLLIPFTKNVGLHFQFLTNFLYEVPQKYGDEWKNNAVKCFIELFHDDSFSLDVKSKILQNIVIPSLKVSFSIQKDLIYEYIQVTTSYCKHFHESDNLKVQLLQLNCMLLEHGADFFAGDKSCCGYNCLYREMVFFSKYCIWDGNRCHNLRLKSHGNLLLMHILKSIKTLPNENIASQVFSNLCDICPPDIQHRDLIIVQSLLENKFAHKKLNFRKWAEELFAYNLKEHALSHLLNMLTHCFKVFNFQFRNFVTDFIEVANLSDFNQKVSKENKELIYEIFIKMFEKIEVIDKEWIVELFSDIESNDDELLSEMEKGLILSRKDPAPCSRRDVCLNKSLRVIACDESCSELKDVTDFVNCKIHAVEETVGESTDEEFMKNIATDLGFKEEEIKSSIVEFKYKMTHAALNYLLEFACQNPSDEYEETLLEKCCSFLKSTLSSNYFNHCLDLKWGFKCNDKAYSLRSNAVESDLLLHIILTKLNLETSYQAKLEAFFKNSLSLFHWKEICAKLFECLLEIKQYIDSNTIDFEKKIHEKMILHIICFFVHGKLCVDLGCGPNFKGVFFVPHLIDVLEVVDLSMISFYGCNLIKHVAGQCTYDIKMVPVEKIFKVLVRPYRLGCFDLFIHEMLYKVYLISQTSDDLTKCLEFNDVIQYALSSRWKDTLLTLIENRGEKDNVPTVPPLVPQTVCRNFMSLDYEHFIKVANMISHNGPSPLEEMDFLTANIGKNKFFLRSWVACFSLGLRMIPNETPESAFPQNLLRLNLPSMDFSNSLVSLAFQSEDFASFLWDCLIPKTWNLLQNKDDQAKVLQKFLDEHIKMFSHEGNLSLSIVRFTESLLKISPSPFEASFLKKCGDHYLTWGKTGTLFHLEDMYYENFELPTFNLLCEVYSRLGEQDMLSGLLKLFPNEHIVSAATLEQQGLFEDAKDEYNEGFQNTGLKICRERSGKCVKELGEWPLNFNEWKPLEVSCICNDVKRKFNLIINDVNEFKALSLKPMISCSEWCEVKRQKLNLQKISILGEKFISNEWKILPQTISEAHVALLQAKLKMTNTSNAAQFLMKMKDGLYANDPFHLPAVFNEWNPSPHESTFFWHQVQGYKLHLWKQLEVYNMSEDFDKFCKYNICQIKKQLANVLIMHRFPAIYIQRSLGTSYMEDLEAFKLLFKATYLQKNILHENKMKTMLETLLSLSATEENIYRSHPEIVSLKVKIVRDLEFLRRAEGNPYTIAEFLLGRSFMVFENSFLSSEVNDFQRLTFGKHNIESLLEDCRIKGRKDSAASMARVIFFLTVDKRLGYVVPEEKWSIIPLLHWLPWISELVNLSLDYCQPYVDNSQNFVMKIIIAVGKIYPQSLYVCLQGIKSNTSDPESISILTQISNFLQEYHPNVKFALDVTYVKLCNFKKERSIPALQNLIEALDELLGISYVCLKEKQNFNDTRYIWRNLRFRLMETPTCAGFENMMADIDSRAAKREGLHSVLAFISKWIEFHSKSFPLFTRIKCPVLLKYYNKNLEVDLLTLGFDKAYDNDLNKVKIFEFLPKMKLVRKFQDVTYRFYIKGSDGKIYPYTFVSEPFLQPIRRGNNFNHFMSCLNSLLDENRDAAMLHLHLKVPDIVTLSAKVHILRDSPSSSLFNEICLESIPQGINPVENFYRLAARIYEKWRRRNFSFKKMYAYPKTCLKDWAKRTFENVADYLRFRKQFARSLALFGLLTNTFGFTTQYPSNMLVHKDEGCITNIGYSFDYTNEGLNLSEEEVPLRLTPNISTFLTPAGVRGIFIPAMTAAASCLRQNSPAVNSFTELLLLHQVLYMQYPDLERREGETVTREEIVINILEAARSIHLSISSYEEDYSPIGQNVYNIPSIVEKAQDLKNLLSMDPVWLPWF